MKCFTLDSRGGVKKQVHDEFQMFWVGDVLGHDVDVVSVGQQVREEFGGGQMSDKVVAVQEVCVVGEEILILRLEILAGDSLVSCQQVSEGREGVR